MQGQARRWAVLVLLSSGLLLPVSCAAIFQVLQAIGAALSFVDALA
jgi:hypothetical protein